MTDAIPTGRIRQVIQDGIPVWKLQCPECGHWGQIDDDQLHGYISVNHGPLEPGQDPVEGNGCGCGCTFHESRNWLATAERIA